MSNTTALSKKRAREVVKRHENESVVSRTTIDAEKGWRVTTSLSETAFTLDDRNTLGDSQYFWWKFASELDVNTIPFKGHVCNTEWYNVKDTLESEYLRKQKQEKKHLCESSFVGFRLNEWRLIQNKNDIVLGNAKLIGPNETIVKDEKIVVMRLPTKIVDQIYQNVKTLKLDNTLTEEERINQVVNFSSLETRKPVFIVDKNQPPPGYYCHNCCSPFHFVQNCDMGRRMKPKGIPKMFLEKTELSSDKDNALVLEDGTLVKARILVNNKFE